MGKRFVLQKSTWLVSLQKLGLVTRLFFAFLIASLPISAQEYAIELLDENDGFSTSIIFSIVQDNQGFLWFGTAYDGLMRYDGENVVNFRRDGSPKYSINYNEYGNLLKDAQGRIWMGGWGIAAAVLEPETGQVRYFTHDPNVPNTIGGNYIQELFEDNAGRLWLGSRGNGLSQYLPDKDSFVRYPFNNPVTEGTGEGTSHRRIWAINQLNDDEIWLGTEYGLNRLSVQNKQFDYFLPDTQLGPTGVNKIRQLLPLTEQELLLGTQEGVLTFDLLTKTFTALPVERNLSLGPVYSMLKTYFGQYWVTTSRGLYYFTDQERTLKKVPLGIDDSCALTLFQDRQNIIWMSCEGRGIYKIVPQTFFKTLSHPIASSAYSLDMDKDGNLLIGTEADGIYKWTLSSGELEHVAALSSSPQISVNRLLQDSSNTVWFTDTQHLYQLDKQGRPVKIEPPQGTPNKENFRTFVHIMQAQNGHIWIGTSHGVFVIESLSRPFRYYGKNNGKNNTSLPNQSIAEIYQDKQGRIWIGHDQGLSVWQPQKDSFKHFTIPPSDRGNNETSPVYAIYQDSQQRMWAGSQFGLHLVDEATGRLISKGQESFKGNLAVRIIKGDTEGNIWMVSQIGVLKYNPAKDELREFDESDGLSGARYFVNLATQSDDGTIFISSRDGIHYFNPSQISDRQVDSKTFLTDFEVLGEPGLTPFSLTDNATIDLAPDQNYVRFDFSTLDLLNARQIRYLYKLDGLDEEWIDNGTSNTAVYTNLRGGEYKFRVRPVIKNHTHTDKELTIDVYLATPLWKQTWMLILYAILVVIFISLLVKIRQERHLRELNRQKRFVTELEIQVAEKTREIREESNKLAAANQVKSQFLANMSHEIRTPLTAVIGLSESIIQGDVDDKDITSEVKRIHNQSRHLLSLLNDILDVTKIEENKLAFEPYELDVCGLLDEICDLFASQARAKQLEFNLVKQLPARFDVYVDGLRLKQVLINLISNAIKFTETGNVTVIASKEGEQLLFNVIDTGIGMSDEQLNKVFDVFTQGDNSINRRFGGSGLGLALSQKLVVMMGGEMRVTSELGKGSMFAFSLPVTQVESDHEKTDAPGLEEQLPQLHGEVLLAEDHPDNRRFIARLLERLGLTVVTATNGVEALEIYKIHQPTLILLDIQMPHMDGIQAFNALRELGATQPIIAITANAMAHDIERYKQIGFDHTLTKPIVRQQLIDIVRRYFNMSIDVNEADAALQSTDFQDLRDSFVERLTEDIAELNAAVNDQQMLVELAHKLNGAARILGFKELAQHAESVELAAKDNSDSVQKKVDALISYVDTLTTHHSA